MNVTNKKRQRALLLHYAGEATNEIFDTLPNTTAGEGEDPFNKAVEARATLKPGIRNPASQYNTESKNYPKHS